MAVKIITNSASENMAALHNEIAMMASCNHSNVVEYIGSYLKDDHLWVVMEVNSALM